MNVVEEFFIYSLFLRVGHGGSAAGTDDDTHARNWCGAIVQALSGLVAAMLDSKVVLQYPFVLKLRGWLVVSKVYVEIGSNLITFYC